MFIALLAATPAQAATRAPTPGELRQAKRLAKVKIVKMRVSTSRGGRTLAAALTQATSGPAKGVADCSSSVKRNGRLVSAQDVTLTTTEQRRTPRRTRRLF